MNIKKPLLLALAAAGVAALSSCVYPADYYNGPYYAGSSIPPWYAGPYYYVGGSYYLGGTYYPGRCYYGGRWYDGRYYYRGHYYYGGRFDHHVGEHHESWHGGSGGEHHHR